MGKRFQMNAPMWLSLTWLTFGMVSVRAIDFESFNVSPATLTFSSANPSGTVIRTATGGFTMKGGKKNKPWGLTVSAASSTFTNCAFLPVSAVTVTCTNVTVTGGGYIGTANCASPATLSTSAVTVASGLQGDATQNYTFSINYTLTDSWRYRGVITPSCSLTLNYVVFADE